MSKPITVILGDPNLPDPVKRLQQFNPEDFITLDKLYAALGTLSNYSFSYLSNHAQLIQHLLLNPPEFVLNFCDEGFYNFPTQELHIPALLEMLNIPYSGAGPACLAICYNKALVRAFANELGIPTPLEYYFDYIQSQAPAHSFYPALLKPNTGDSSIGITQHSIVHNEDDLILYIDYLRDLVPGSAILIQEYLTGPEYTVGLIGNADDFIVLPILTVDYSQLPEGLPPILGYESKWEPDSPYWNNIRYLEATLSTEQYDLLVDYAKQLFVRFGCRDYARFDFRTNQHGVIKLLEVNPNPSWCWDGKSNMMAQIHGYSYADFLQLIINAAEKRHAL